MLTRLVFGAAMLGMCATATAIPIVDQLPVNAHVGFLGSVTYQHNLLDQGFVPGTTMATSGSIEIQIYDDGCSAFLCLDEVLPELLLVVIDNFNFDTGGIALGSFSNSLQIKALATINATGLLDVTIQSLGGDFNVGTSTLTVNTVTVPEPATLSLLGLGLIALAFTRKARSRSQGA